MNGDTTPLYMQCEMHAAEFEAETGRWVLLSPDADEVRQPAGVVVEIRTSPVSDDEGPARTGLVAIVPEGAEPRPFKIDYVGRTVDVGGEEAVELVEFQQSAFRCDADGAYVANFLDPLWKQAMACEAAGAAAHVAEIREGVETLRDSDDRYVQIDWRMFDIALSGMTDGMTAEEVLAQARFKNDAPLHAVHGLDALCESETIRVEAGYFDEYGDPVSAEDADEYGAEYRAAHDEEIVTFDLRDWHEIREYPQYMIDGVRAMFRGFMSDIIGDTPIEGITRIQKGTGQVEDICRLLEQRGFEHVGQSKPFSDAARVMGRPYETSDVSTYSGNGLTVIVFQDFAGSYAYAFPELPKPQLAAEASSVPAL